MVFTSAHPVILTSSTEGYCYRDFGGEADCIRRVLYNPSLALEPRGFKNEATPLT